MTLYQQLYQSIKQAIIHGDYQPGQMLPASRLFAEEKGVSRNTVLRVYDMLVSEGYLIGIAGAGMKVASDLPDMPMPTSAEAHLISIPATPNWSTWGQRLAMLEHRRVPPNEPLPSATAALVDFQYGHVEMGDKTMLHWRKLAAKWSRLQSQHYGEPQGLNVLRTALAAHLRTYRGCRCEGDNIVVTSSAQQMFKIAVDLIAEPGDVIAIEEPWYHRFRDTLILAGITVMPIPVDEEGIDIETLSQLSLEQGVRPKLVYVTPSHQFPSGVVMSLSRRLALLEWCHSNDVWVIEDDYDSEFRYHTRPVDALQSLDRHGRVIYIGTLSKVLCPSLRIAYGIFPSQWVSRVVRALWQACRHSAWLEQYMLAELIDSGNFASHIRRQRRLYAANRECLVMALRETFGDAICIQGDKAGLHVLVWLRYWSYEQQHDIISSLAIQGVQVYPIDHLYSTPKPILGLLLGYATLTHRQIQWGVRHLGRVLGDTERTRTC